MALFEVKDKLQIPTHILRDKYLVPPFSILDTANSDWLKHRNIWEDMIKNRSDNVRNITIKKSNTPYRNALNYDDGYKGLERNGNTSTFDPFLCEILVKWFSRPQDTIYDPFAGGHVRGAVSGMLERNYIGVDVNKYQVEANIDNWSKINAIYDNTNFGSVNWILGSSCNIKLPGKYNMLLTCPPYYNLEVYTDNTDDISTCKTYNDFINEYRKSIKLGYDLLEDDSFAVIVVCELRDVDSGIFYGFVPDTIQAFLDAGFIYYNELILANRIMSLGVRCPKYFDRSRKVGRHHQNVLVFYKGNPKNIEKKYGKFIEGNEFI